MKPTAWPRFGSEMSARGKGPGEDAAARQFLHASQQAT